VSPMPSAHEAIDAAIGEIDRIRRLLKRGGSPQVRSTDERDVIRATCLAWFNNHRPDLRQVIGEDLLQTTDSSYKGILAAADRATARRTYDEWLKGLRRLVSDLRSHAVAPPSAAKLTPESPPTFDSLVPDPAMRKVLSRRWEECTKCVSAKAPLAATVMMGGLLEALLLARVHRESDKSSVFRAVSAPRDVKTGKSLMLQEWTLRSYIDVAHELGWITSSAKDLGEVVRDYRNYIHPHKELTHGVHLGDHDARLFWEVAKGISRQLLETAST
jgi:hypothetical protein